MKAYSVNCFNISIACLSYFIYYFKKNLKIQLSQFLPVSFICTLNVRSLSADTLSTAYVTFFFTRQ